MSRFSLGRLRAVGITLLLLAAHSMVRAQNVQFLPETDVYLKLSPSWRTYLQAKNDQDAGGSPELSIGPSLQLYVKPLLTLKNITGFDLDDSKKRALVLEAGYRYITAPGAVPENRLETIATSHFPLQAQFLISDRYRDLEKWFHLALSKQTNNRPHVHGPLLSLHPLCRRRGLLRKPVLQMEHNQSPCRLPVSCGQIRPVRSVLPTRKQYR